MGSVRRSPLRRGGWLRVATVAALLLLVAEGAARLVLFGRPDAWRSGASVRVLLLGDSIPFGAGVEAEEAFPARFQGLLDAQAPGRFSILNLAVPGMNTTQVRRRLASRVAHYDPDLVVAMVGANNARNESEAEYVAPAALARPARRAGAPLGAAALRSGRSRERCPPCRRATPARGG